MIVPSPMFAQYAPIPVVVIPVGDDCTAAIVSPALQSTMPPDPELELDPVALDEELDELLDAVTPPEPMSPPVPLTELLPAPLVTLPLPPDPPLSWNSSRPRSAPQPVPRPAVSPVSSEIFASNRI
jgi:hypothetical protein